MSKIAGDNAKTIPALRQEPNGFYYAFWSEGRRSRRKSMGARDQAVATARFAQWLLIDGTGQNDAVDYTVADCWLVYDRKHVQTDAVVARGRATIASSWKNLEPFFGPCLVPEIDQHRVDDYAALRTRQGARPATIRRELACLFAALNYCAGKAKMFSKALIEDVDLPADSPPRDRWLTMDEVQKLLDAAATFRGADDRLTRGERFLWLALFTAGRERALLELTWDRIDFTTGTIHLNVPGRRVTKKRRADVTIATQLRPVLERAYKERTGPLVLDSDRTSVWTTIQRIAARAGLGERRVGEHGKPLRTGISPHVLRHTAATHMARGGVPLWKIAKTLGNTSAMVEKVYAKWAPDDAAGTVDLISGGVLEAAE